MKQRAAIYAGSFDPFTNGHKDIVDRGLRLFDKIVVLIAVSPFKKPMLDKETRRRLLEEIFANYQNVVVDCWDGLIVEYAKKNQLDTVIRGLRPTGDFEVEFQMATMNQKLYPEIDTIFLMTGRDSYFVSSTLIRDIIKHGGEISEFVAPNVLKALKEKMND